MDDQEREAWRQLVENAYLQGHARGWRAGRNGALEDGGYGWRISDARRRAEEMARGEFTQE